jgi:hypothetical protein
VLGLGVLPLSFSVIFSVGKFMNDKFQAVVNAQPQKQFLYKFQWKFITSFQTVKPIVAIEKFLKNTSFMM